MSEQLLSFLIMMVFAIPLSLILIYFASTYDVVVKCNTCQQASTLRVTKGEILDTNTLCPKCQQGKVRVI